MGAYINPVNQTKESWLRENSEDGALFAAPKSIDEKPGYLPVCLVDNGAFRAAGIAFNVQELLAFTYPDGRRREWYWVSKEKLMDPDVSDLHYYLKG